MQKLLTEMVMYVVGSMLHNGIYLILGILVAAVIKVYVDPEKIKQSILRKSGVSIPGSVGFGAFTPLCACGTMAVVVAMLTTALPWGPIMAFLTSSPLMSPDTFIMLAGIVSMKFAIALAAASIIIGLGSGYITHLIEKKTDFLTNQTRFAEKTPNQSCACADAEIAPTTSCGCGTASDVQPSQFASNSASGHGNTRGMEGVGKISRIINNAKLRELKDAFMNVGVKQILLYFTLFVAIGFLINRFVPTSIIVALFSGKNIFAVPLAALIGLPIYVTGESAIPLIKTLIAGGAGGGSMLAFMITGPGTSAGVIAGISTFMKKRAVILYIAFILGWGILLGYIFDLLLRMGI